jgi:hypothetical protein
MLNLVDQLANSELLAFSNWPNDKIPDVCSGVYAIYDSGESLLYVGMAGAGLTPKNAEKKKTLGKRSGLVDRLNSHAGGQRSGDRFNIYIADLFVMPSLSPEQISSIADQHQSFDNLIREYIRLNLYYRFLETPYGAVRSLETELRTNGIHGQLPSINKII